MQKGALRGFKRHFFYLALVFVLSISVACATSSRKLTRISLGMTKDKVVSILGEPAVARGAIRNKYDQVIEVWEYRLTLPSTDTAGEVIGKSFLTVLTFGMGAILFTGKEKDYWLYFFDAELVQWGQAGDWSREADRIYEFNFASQPKLHK